LNHFEDIVDARLHIDGRWSRHWQVEPVMGVTATLGFI
jgi:hypothetical protein